MTGHQSGIKKAPSRTVSPRHKCPLVIWISDNIYAAGEWDTSLGHTVSDCACLQANKHCSERWGLARRCCGEAETRLWPRKWYTTSWWSWWGTNNLETVTAKGVREGRGTTCMSVCVCVFLGVRIERFHINIWHCVQCVLNSISLWWQSALTLVDIRLSLLEEVNL